MSNSNPASNPTPAGVAAKPVSVSTSSRFELRDWAPLISFLCILAFFSALTPGFVSLNTVRQVLEQGATLAIAATGLTFVLLCGEIDLAVGKVALFAACLCGVMLSWTTFGGPTGVTPAGVAIVILVPIVCCLLMGWLSGWLTTLTQLPSFIITLAVQYIADGLSRFLTRGSPFKLPAILQTIGNNGVYIISPQAAGKTGTPFLIPYSIMLAAAVMLIAHLVLQYTPFGRYVYMVGGNREAARLAGVRVQRVIIACLAICGVTAAMAGLVNSGRLYSVTVDQNQELLLNAVACVVLGGTSLLGGEGGIGRTVLGVATFTTLNVGLIQTKWINDHFRIGLLGMVLLSALVINGVLTRRQSR